MSYNNFRTFEELERSIKRVGDKWIASTDNADKDSTYKGKWSMLSLLNQFVERERKDYKEKLNSMRSTYAPKFLAEQEQKLTAEFNTFINGAKAKEKESIKALADKKYQQVIEMLTATPTAEQVRLLNVLQMRNDLDAVEVHHILPTFFKNYQAMRVLDTISKANGITLNIPAQLDCRVMFENIKRATEYLLGAVDEIGKPKDKQDVKYGAFFFIHPEDMEKCSDPVYNGIIEVFDNIPQLNDCKTEKTGLNSVEQTKIDWYYRGVNKDNVQGLIEHTEKVITTHPEVAPLLKYTPYGEYLDIIAKARAEGADS